MTPVRWLLVDYGGVLAFSHLPDAETRLATLFGCEISRLRSAITEKSRLGELIRLDRISEDEFWTGVAQQLMGSSRMPASAGELTCLWSGCYGVDPAVAQALKHVALQGIRIGVATNIDRYREPYMIAAIADVGLEAAIYPSYRMGAIKPAPPFFAQTQREIEGSACADVTICFVDDRPEHVAAAAAQGWPAQRYAQDPALFYDLAGLARPAHYGGTDA